MPIPAALPFLRRKAGNPNWASGRPFVLSPAVPTEFEMQVRELELTPETYTSSVELRRWCERNKNDHYIPEWLLKAWNIKVNPDISSAA
jgi:hypothetical protein